MSVFRYVLLTAVTLPVLSILFIFYYLFYRIPPPGNIFRYSKTEVRNVNGVDCLFYGDLPCHTYFNGTTRKKIDISDKWKLDLTGTEVNLPHCCNTFGSEFLNYTGPEE
ncbi:MAG: hypothetical protein ACLFST_13950 [Spirochaetia bacterium]